MLLVRPVRRFATRGACPERTTHPRVVGRRTRIEGSRYRSHETQGDRGGEAIERSGVMGMQLTEVARPKERVCAPTSDGEQESSDAIEGNKSGCGADVDGN